MGAPLQFRCPQYEQTVTHVPGLKCYLCVWTVPTANRADTAPRLSCGGLSGTELGTAVSHPDRNAQIEHTTKRGREFQRFGQPLISLDTKQKELVAEVKNAGRERYPEGQRFVRSGIVTGHALNKRPWPRSRPRPTTLNPASVDSAASPARPQRG
ncbi:MAG: ISAzo13-like element transposase-related protein [Gammaproteobacteria bacterium]